MYHKLCLRLSAGALALLVLAACNDDSPEKPSSDAGSSDGGDVAADANPDATSNACPLDGTAPADDVAADINGWTVSVDGATGAWSITAAGGDEPVLAGPGSCGRDDDGWHAPARVASGEADVKSSFGNFRIELESEQASLEWLSTANIAPSVEQTDDAVVISWPLPLDEPADAAAELRFSAEGAQNLAVELTTNVEDLDTGEITTTCRPDEAFFGLGSQTAGMNLRGRTFPLWTQEQGNSKPEDGGTFPLNNFPEAAYAPMGIWHSSAGYAAIIGHDSYSEIDLCEESADRVRLRSHKELPRFVLVAGESPKERLTAITEYTGRVDPAPPAWVFGPWFDAVGGPWRVEEVATALRDNDIPASAIWTEDWIGGKSTATGYRLSYAWEWDDELYPNLPDTIDGLQNRGFAFLGYFNPFIPTNVRMFTEGEENGYLIQTQEDETYLFQDPAFRNSTLIDLTNPDAVDWLQGYMTKAADELGIDGWMADFAEWLPVDAKLHSGQTGWEFHNQYPLAWQKANKDALTEAHADQSPSNDWTFFARSGWASTNGGSAGFAATMWGGDQNTNWRYDDGFPTIVPIGAHLGLSGVSLYGSDIAGYNSLGTSNTDKELFFRWSAAGAFHPLMRTHHGGDKCDNWNFDRDAETLAHYRRWASVHTLLYPYFQRLVTEATEEGLPITRHPFLVEPNRPALWTGDGYQFFTGDDILVAPVLADDATDRTVTLPEQGWWPLFGDTPALGTPAQGDAVTVDVSAPVTEIPVFVRPGTILPLLSEAVDSFYGSSEPGVTDLADVDGELRLALYPDTEGNVQLGLDDGVSASGAGWTSTSSLDWNSASLGDTALPTCDSTGADASCVDPAAKTARLVGVTEATLKVGSAQLSLSADEATDFVVGVAGDAWGEWTEATPYTGLNADAPSWCEGHTE
ncbi:hypothetical protein FIV42_00105 [Persicimonas caeni]|uniref:Glycoside hydrolase family 31 protein n=1 Tax=Persicimonas caeni TaxID=2292766 RepID=A0A4Y6PMZ6_PERCE|nr:TIM-barrel domain-containing protein [Persicimonas caeni]QDG49195.1 hypothetical protein FIV42_00105 [Persicimonas caeni]QED30416.1 hypothetical protein FRD00_00100 [Persicimonas caeni]